MAAKAAFRQAHAGELAGCAVGLGTDLDRDAWTIQVLVQSGPAERDLPSEFEGLRVDVRDVGVATAL